MTMPSKPVHSPYSAMQPTASPQHDTPQQHGQGVESVSHRPRGEYAGTPPLEADMPDSLLVGPSPDNAGLFQPIAALDQGGNPLERYAVTEKVLTVFLDGREVVSAMTLGDHPEYLAIGFLLNQKMIEPEDAILSVEYRAEDEAVLVHTTKAPPEQLGKKRRIHTSGCAIGTMFGEVMEVMEGVWLPTGPGMRASEFAPAIKKIEKIPSLHNKTGALHRCVLCENDAPLVYMEDVGRHNALDKIAGYMHMQKMSALNKYIYTTGRLTSEIVIKSVIMGVPLVVSRSSFTMLAIELASKTNLTLVGRFRGNSFQVLSGAERVIFDISASLSGSDA